jgi:hypothetical protein
MGRAECHRLRCALLTLSMKAVFHRCYIERRSHEIHVEQLDVGEWSEHSDALDVVSARGTNLGAAERAFAGSVEIGQMLVLGLAATDAAQSRECPCSQATSAAKHPFLLCAIH